MKRFKCTVNGWARVENGRVLTKAEADAGPAGTTWPDAPAIFADYAACLGCPEEPYEVVKVNIAITVTEAKP